MEPQIHECFSLHSRPLQSHILPYFLRMVLTTKEQGLSIATTVQFLCDDQSDQCVHSVGDWPVPHSSHWFRWPNLSNSDLGINYICGDGVELSLRIYQPYL